MLINMKESSILDEIVTFRLTPVILISSFAVFPKYTKIASRYIVYCLYINEGFSACNKICTSNIYILRVSYYK